MTIDQRIYEIILSVPSVASDVWVQNVHAQSNDEHENNYSISNPMITYAELWVRYSRVKAHWLYQITVWSDKKLKAKSIAKDILSYLDMIRDVHFNYSRIPWSNAVYDYKEKMHGEALTVNVVSRK